MGDDRRDEDLPQVHDLTELADMVRRCPELHVRWSRGPDHDAGSTSRDYESGLELPGLSVNTLDPEDWWTRPLEDWLARQLCQYSHLADGDDGRRPWLLTGRLAGFGPDHEPLLADVRPVAWLADSVVDQALARYRERFAVGNDST